MITAHEVAALAAVLSAVASAACLLIARTWVALARDHRAVMARLATAADRADEWVAGLVAERERWERERRRFDGE